MSSQLIIKALDIQLEAVLLLCRAYKRNASISHVCLGIYRYLQRSSPEETINKPHLGSARTRSRGGIVDSLIGHDVGNRQFPSQNPHSLELQARLSIHRSF